MAKRRMFDLDIVDTDVFIEMSGGARLLYYDLGMRADDDGFVASPRKIMKMTNASEDDLKVLIAKNFIIPFESGVCVIRHWKMNNYIQKDRYKATIYLKEKSLLWCGDNNVYEMETKCIHRIDKSRVEKNRIEHYKDKNLNDLFIEFLELRKKLKAVNSERAVNMLKEKLNNYDDKIKMQMLEQSVVNSWKSVYELKEYNNKNVAKEPSWLNTKQTKEPIDEETRKELDELLSQFK